MKNKLIFGVIGSFVLATSGLLVGCGGSGQANVYNFNSKEELISFSVVSGMELAMAQVNSVSISNKNNVEFNAMIDNIHSFLPSFEGFLGGDKILVPNEQTSDNLDFEKMMIVEYGDLNGNLSEYKLYYNETLKQDSEIDKDEDEVESSIVGQVVYGENIFSLTGEREIEEGEMGTSFKIEMGEGSYIIIEQEKENNEEEFVYTIFENNEMVYSHSFEVKIENGRVEFETEIETPTSEIELEIKKSQNEENVFFIEYEDNNKEYKIKVEVSSNEQGIVYTYTMGNDVVEKIVG